MKQQDISPHERLIFALDVASSEEAERWLDLLGNEVRFYKVGLQLFMASWFSVIDSILLRGHQVMVDLKFFDIPETVALAVSEVAKRGATFITVHGNEPILRAAVAACGQAKILAVTVLTSFDESDLRGMGMTRSIEDLVFSRAKKALDLQCAGVVSSGLEAARLRRDLGNRLLIVTPGIRPGKNNVEDDQKRVVDAYTAIKNGASHIVVGRPIRDAQDPVAVVRQMQQDIARALAERP